MHCFQGKTLFSCINNAGKITDFWKNIYPWNLSVAIIGCWKNSSWVLERCKLKQIAAMRMMKCGPTLVTISSVNKWPRPNYRTMWITLQSVMDNSQFSKGFGLPWEQAKKNEVTLFPLIDPLSRCLIATTPHNLQVNFKSFTPIEA